MKINKPIVFIVLSFLIITVVITVFSLPSLSKMEISVTDTNIPKTNTGIGGYCNTYEIKVGTKIVLNNNVCSVSEINKRYKEVSFTLEKPLISELMDITEFSLKIGKKISLYDYDYIYDFELIKKGSVTPHEFDGMVSYNNSKSQYVFIQSDDLIKPNLILNKDGTFTFNSSHLSSYIAKGTYTKTDKALTLETYDKKNLYRFTIEGNTLKFDKSYSSVIPEYSEITIPNDAVFVQIQ